MAVDINPVVYWLMALCCLVGGTKISEECTISVFVAVGDLSWKVAGCREGVQKTGYREQNGCTWARTRVGELFYFEAIPIYEFRHI